MQSVQGNKARSFSFMIQTTSTSYNSIITTGSFVSQQLFSVCFGCGVVGAIGVNNYGSTKSASKVINDGLWHSVLVTYDGTTLIIYVDGISSLNGNIGLTINTVGNDGNYIYSYYSGSLKNVQFYDYIVSNSVALKYSYQSAGSLLYTSGMVLNFCIMTYYICEY